jgi:hypothetical protein
LGHVWYIHLFLRSASQPSGESVYRHLTLFDYASTLILGAKNILGLILLFLLRKSAVRWLAIGLILNEALSIRILFVSSYRQMVPAPPSWIYLLGGFLVGLAILLYAVRLGRVGILSEAS